ncbi:MAG: membrane protein insertase YidC [Bacteroidales bacterium]|nr:membrane protein insertase YidC [Bacteroidales bacterium]
MNSKGSSVIGFALIGVILLLFSWYNSKQYEKAVEANRPYYDSLARVNQDLAAGAAEAELPALTLPAEDAPLYQSASLQAAAQGEAAFCTLENDKIAVTLSTKGAQPWSVLVKDYFTYDSLELNLIGAGRSSLEYEINADQWINTGELNFTVVSASPERVVMRLPFDADSYMEATYSLAAESYMVDYDLRFVNMNDILDRRTTQVEMKWVADLPRLEKGYKNERNYSSIAFRYAGEKGSVKTVGQRKESFRESYASRMRWVGFQQQFFSAILVADNDFTSGTLVNKFYGEDNADRLLMQSGADMTLDLDARSADYSIPMHFYFGPNHFYTLKSYGQKFENIIPLGGKVIGTISRYVIIPLFNWMSGFIASYGLIILLLTLIIKIVISPLTLKSYMSSAKMSVLKPEIDKINARYPKKEDAMKKQQATMELYKKAGVSTMGGCLPILLQFPILWAMFRFFPASFELRQQRFLWADDLSGYDSILDFGFNVPLFGDHFSLFAFLMAVSMFFYTRMTMKNTDTSAMPGMKFMNMWLMPIMMWFLCNNFSAGLSYYYMLSNIITIIQNWVIRKWFVDEKKIYAKLQAASAKPTKKSKFQQRIDQMYKMQQQQAAQQNKK